VQDFSDGSMNAEEFGGHFGIFRDSMDKFEILAGRNSASAGW